MKNFFPPKEIYGIIKVSPESWTDKYYIGEANFAIEKIGAINMINIWGNSYHYELHNGKEVYMDDVGFEIIQPLKNDISKFKINEVVFPKDIDFVENNWEDLYYGHFYQFEHLKITHWKMTILFIPEEELFKIDLKGYITDDIREKSSNHFIECSFKTKMKAKIQSKFNSKFYIGL